LRLSNKSTLPCTKSKKEDEDFEGMPVLSLFVWTTSMIFLGPNKAENLSQLDNAGGFT
jgi:hypothetical protein